MEPNLLLDGNLMFVIDIVFCVLVIKFIAPFDGVRMRLYTWQPHNYCFNLKSFKS